MKKTRFYKIIIALFCLSLIFSLNSCKRDNEQIKIQKMPVRCVFFVGETPQLDGMELSAVKNGEMETVKVTEEMLGSENKIVFAKAGAVTLTLDYENTAISFEIYVDDSLENHKAYALSSLSEWSEKNVLDDASRSIIELGKEKISKSETHKDIVSAEKDTKRLASDYIAIIKAEQTLYNSKVAMLESFSDFDFSELTLDQIDSLTATIEASVVLVNSAETPEEIEQIGAEITARAEEMKADKHNEAIFELEREFNSVYGEKSAFYTSDEYTLLISALIEAEKSIREMTTPNEADVISRRFLDETAPNFDTYPDVIFKKLNALKSSDLIYGEGKERLNEISNDIFTLINNVDGASVNTGELDGIEDLASLEKITGIKSLLSYISICKYENESAYTDIITEALQLYENYKKLEQANTEAKAVINTIDNIGVVRLDSEEKITNARNAYNAWSKKFSIKDSSPNAFIVSNYDKLLDAEKEIKELPEKAKAAAEALRSEIKALLEKNIVYSDTEKGVKSDIESAYALYNKWIDTYGDSIDTYLNDGVNYKLKLDSYNNEYKAIEEMANSVLKKMEEIRSLLTQLNYDNYVAISGKADKDYLELSTLYDKFKNANCFIVDKVSEYPLIKNEILQAKYNAHSERYIALIKTEYDGYVKLIDTNSAFRTHRSNLRDVYDSVKESFDSAFSLSSSIEVNLNALKTSYDEKSQELKNLYNNYCYDFEEYSAKAKLADLSREYESKLSIFKIDSIIKSAEDKISSLSKKTTLEIYTEGLKSIIEEAKAKLESEYNS